MELAELDKRFAEIESKLIGIEHTTDKRVYLLCESENSFAVCRFVFENLGMRFAIATVIDGNGYYEILYHFCHDETGCVATVKSFIRDTENPSAESIATFVPGALWIEREMHDVMGIEFRNHPDMRRLILADDWPEGVYPLRKEVKQ